MKLFALAGIQSSEIHSSNHQPMDKVSLYLRESYNELVHNVSWPTYSTLQTNTILVLAGSAVFALLIFGMDVVWQFIVDNIYGITA